MESLFTTLARDVMTKNVICVYPKMSIKELSTIFIENLITNLRLFWIVNKMSSGLFHKLTLSNLIYTLKIIWILVWRKQGYVQDIMAPLPVSMKQILSQWLLIKCAGKRIIVW